MVIGTEMPATRRSPSPDVAAPSVTPSMTANFYQPCYHVQQEVPLQFSQAAQTDIDGPVFHALLGMVRTKRIKKSTASAGTQCSFGGPAKVKGRHEFDFGQQVDPQDIQYELALLRTEKKNRSRFDGKPVPIPTS